MTAFTHRIAINTAFGALGSPGMLLILGISVTAGPKITFFH